ncbi:unnamed protein product [Cylicocyclus nassatus]|uniref:F-box domain-containing protein n=1 Tax=Cylicocyclus nassatus TaxID=53992 RepID=A0AA36GUE9_CYLNA|nr:unnamed protein product [Cylicocyclus nassatus]
MSTSINDLPPEMIVRILQECDILTISRLTAVCKFMRLIIDAHHKALPRRELKSVTVHSDSLTIVRENEGMIGPEEKVKPHGFTSLEQSGNVLAFADVGTFRLDMLTLTDEKSTTWSSFFRTFHTKASSLHFNITVVTTSALLDIVESLCPKSLTIEFEMTEGPLRVPRLCQHHAVQKISALTLLNSNILDECLDTIRIPTVHLQGNTEITGFGLQNVLSDWLAGKRTIKLYEIAARGFVSPSHLFHNIPAEHVEDSDSWLIRRGDDVLMAPSVKRKLDEVLEDHQSIKVRGIDEVEQSAVTTSFCKDWFHAAKSILILGDGNLSFSLAVAECEPNIPITATVLDSESDFEARYPSCANPEKLKKHDNVDLLFKIDATDLPQEWKGRFHYIVMNFPHPGGKTNLRKSRELASAIFRGVGKIMTKETEFYLALAKGQAGVEPNENGSVWSKLLPNHSKDSWQALYLAADEGLLLTDLCTFPSGAFAGYSSSGYKSTSKGFNNSRGAVRMLFKKSPIFTSLSDIVSLKRDREDFHLLRSYFYHDVSFLFSEDIEEGENIVFDLLRELAGSAVIEIREIEELRSMCPDPYLPNRIYRLTWQIVEVAVGKRLCNDLQEQLRGEIQKSIRCRNLPLILT